MSPSGTSNPEYARNYDRLRPADSEWRELFDVLVEEGGLAGRRVLDVGCGTGRLAAELAALGSRVWGVDPSEEMLARARANAGRSVGLKRGRAEDLPFTDGWFERAVLRLVAHHVERERAFPELARVLAPGGRLVIATFATDHLDGFWLNPFFPTVERIDRERFPDPAVLQSELLAAGFAAARTRRLVQPRVVDRATALERIRGRFISTLNLVPDDEFTAGLARAERELPDPVETELRWAILVADR